MEESTVNFAEYRVEKKSEGTYKLKRILLVAGWCMVPLLFIVLGLSITAVRWLIWLTPVVVMMTIYTSRYTFKFVSIEYEYAVVSGEIRVDYIYGSSIRKPMVTAKFRDMSVIAPYTEQYRAQADDASIVRRYEAISSLSSPDVYFGVFTNEDGEKSVLFFDATAKILKLAKLFNPTTVVTQVRY